MKAIKNDAQRLLVAVIAGPNAPYQVHWKAPPGTTDTSCGATSCPWPEITHSCTAGDQSFADPAVRLSDFTQAFGSDGFFLSICDDFAPSMRKVGELFAVPAFQRYAYQARRLVVGDLAEVLIEPLEAFCQGRHLLRRRVPFVSARIP